MVGAFEREDARLAGREQCRPERDLDRVLAGDSKLGRPRQPSSELERHLGFGQIAERVHDPLRAPGVGDQRIAVPQRRNPEAAGKVEVFPAVGVDDPTPLSLGPDQAEPLRRGTNRPRVSAAM